MIGSIVFFSILSLLAIIGGWLVFRLDSMVRVTYALLISFLAVAVMLLMLNSEFLFAIGFLMMIGEMTIMVLFMVAFMMNSAGLNPMSMVHQPRFAAGAGIITFLVLALAILTAEFPISDRAASPDVTAAIGFELLGPSMLIFETAGVTLLTGMIAVIAMAARRGRFENAVVVDPKAKSGDDEQHHHH